MSDKLREWFSYLSISQKLNIIVFIGLMTTVFISAVVIVFYDRTQTKQSLASESKVLSNILGVRSGAALLFRDKKTAEANLSTLFERKETLYACIYDKDKQLFSEYINKGKGCVDDISVLENEAGEIIIDWKEELITVEPILLKGNQIGNILISSSLDKLNQRTLSISLGIISVLFIASVISLIITRRLQNAITGPILNLARVAEKVIKHKDYSIRGKSVYHDETEILTDTFNQMLHHIQGVQLEMGQFIEELKEDTKKSKDEADEQIERNESIRHYFSGVTHDLKQPLQAIEMFSSILVTTNEDQRDLVNNKLRASVANLRQMFDDWLNVSKLEDSLKQLNKSQVNIQTMMNAIESEVSVLASDKHLKLKVHCPDFQIYTNEKMIERIIRNLLSNAIRYTEKGGIILACRKTSQGFKIQVSDTGIGISEEKQASVFEKFTQVSENKQLTGQGYGLGLSIVKKFCDTLGHEIELKSKPNMGTTFSIIIKEKTVMKPKLPVVKFNRRISDQRKIIEKELVEKKQNQGLNPFQVSNKDVMAEKKVEPNQAENPQAKTTPSTPSPSSVKPFKGAISGSSILIIDDDTVILDAIVSQIQSWDANVVGVSTVEDAREQLESNEFNLIISDYQLGENIHGVEVLNTLNAELVEKGKDEIKSFIITATLDKTILADIKSSKYEYMPKPLKPAKLRAKIEFFFKNNINP